MNPLSITNLSTDTIEKLKISIPKILVANRGEVAVRIMRTASKLGIKTVAIYSKQDEALPFVKMADEKIFLDGDTISDTYLNIDKIIDAAEISGAKAIHPGYGFLSENSEFVKRVNAANLIFIGPDAETMDLMGDKIKARTAMIAADIPVVPGYNGSSQDEAVLLLEAEKIGYPLMIKATAGGGGKGMRLVLEKNDFHSSLNAAQREAENAFGNATVFLEKYITNPRHIEVQLMCDAQGNAFHFFERECSIQRRHQKIIEESPAVNISNDFKNRLCETAVKVAKTVNYTSAGTVEFIVDDKNNFYFLEMNTRLQVEHPITELVCNVNIVELSLLAAAKIPFPFKQEEIKQNGFAIEVRLYAEDPANNFLPATGKLEFLKFSETILNEKEILRIDSGVESGNEISIYYDPMIAKIIYYSPVSRSACIQGMINSLKDTVIFGLRTNLNFLINILSHQAFLDGEINTHFISNFFSEGFNDTKELWRTLKNDSELKELIAFLTFHNETAQNTIINEKTIWEEFSA